MARSIDRLLKSISADISATPASREGMNSFLKPLGKLGNELGALLCERDGFYAFESALLVRSFDSPTSPQGLVQWNSPTLWKDSYDQVFDNNIVFFAEDLFGGQFCIRAEAVWLFDPELGEYQRNADSLEAWATEIVDNPEIRTGFPLVLQWQVSHGALENGCRLVPKLPFFVGGKFEVENLYACQEVTGMRFRGAIAKQARDLPDGSQISFRVGPEPSPPGSK
jgi:hypothetical protein